jgi:hypothetical protein
MKQQTLEKAAEQYRKTTSNNMYLEKTAFIAGAEWQQEQSKQMEKMQLYNFIDFINERYFNSFRISKDEVEQYYNETFKQQEQ